MTLLEVALAIAAIPALTLTGYLLLLTIASRRPAAPGAPAASTLSFDVIIPAHDEEAGIAATVQSLLQLAWPRELFRVVVVADNCSDQTAAKAEAAGATVLVRRDDALRGKGYALAHAFDHVLRGPADAVVVVDADTLVSPNLLSCFAARIERGAGAVQADYAVRNPEASWRTLLMAIALGLFHRLRSAARENLGLSCGLRGNGMCFSRAVIGEVPHGAVSIVEDVEYGLALGEKGHRVHYAGEAHVYGEMVSGGAQAVSQRLRWERGRAQLARRRALRLFLRALRQRDLMLFDLAMDMLLPPLSTLALTCTVGFVAAAALCFHRGAAGPSFWLWTACAAALCLYVARGWQLSGTGAKGLLALFLAPAFIAWKFSLALRRPAPRGEWIRTAREGQGPASDAHEPATTIPRSSLD